MSDIIGAGIVPAALEFVDDKTIHAVEASVFKAGYPLDARAALLIELDGFQDGIEEMSAAISEICRKNQAYEVRVAKNDQERAQLWLGRKGAFGAMGRVSPDMMVMDVTPLIRVTGVTHDLPQMMGMHDMSSAFHYGQDVFLADVAYVVTVMVGESTPHSSAMST